MAADHSKQYQIRHSGSFLSFKSVFGFREFSNPSGPYESYGIELALTEVSDYSSKLICRLTVNRKDRDELPVKYWVSILDSSFKQEDRESHFDVFTDQHMAGDLIYLLNPTWLAKPRTKERWLHNGNLFIVLCEYQILEEIKPDPKLLAAEEKLAQQYKQSGILSQTLGVYGSLLKTGKFSDVVVVAGGQEFQVHKSILAINSPVFSAMLENDFKEKKEGRIEIADMGKDICQVLGFNEIKGV